MIAFPSERREEEKQENSNTLKTGLRFTKKEIKLLPVELRKYITVEIIIPVRQKPNGVYEARYRAHGINIYAAAADFDQLQPRFYKAMLNYAPRVAALDTQKEQDQARELPPFNAVCARWLELKAPTIKATTYKFYVQLFTASIYPVFNGRKVDDVKQSDVQKLINDYIDQGKYRTATKIYQALKAVFDFAVGDELLARSPMRLLRPPKYEERNGSAFSLEEERAFLEAVQGSKCAPEIKAALLFLLYTGIRRSELASAEIANGFVSVVCAKTRKGFAERRRLIPITPMLARWLPCVELDKLRALRPDALTQALKRLAPSHHLHDLRHTFITRCQECGVAREVVSVWAGHAADNTQTTKVYTHFSPEFMQREAQKVKY